MVRLCVHVPPVCVAAGGGWAGRESSVRPIPSVEETDFVQPDDRGADAGGHVRLARRARAFPWVSITLEKSTSLPRIYADLPDQPFTSEALALERLDIRSFFA